MKFSPVLGSYGVRLTVQERFFLPLRKQSVMRLAGVLLLTLGAAIAAIPWFVAKPDDDMFFQVLRVEDHTAGELSLRGALYGGGETYSFTAEEQYVFDDAGHVVAAEATLHARDASGRTKVYRRTRHFDKWGSLAEHVEESPTRTIKRGRGPTGEGEYREEVLSDKTPLLARPLVRVLAHGAGALMVICGLSLIVFRRR